MVTHDGNGWSKYEQYVLAALDRLEGGMKELHVLFGEHCKETERELDKLRGNVRDIRTRFAIYGGIAVAVMTSVSPVVYKILEHVFGK